MPELSALVAEHPYRERFSALLMLALYRSGRQADALAAYRRTRTRLDEDLGIDPGPALRDLHAAILRSDAALDPRAEPRARPAQLPPDLVSLIGREAELEKLLDLGGGAVVISAIDGMAGIGKTALAVHAAHRLAPAFPDGQIFLDLHGFTHGVAAVDPLIALDRLLRAIGVPTEQIPNGVEERSALWRSRLAGLRMLIVLDNAADEDQVRPLLPSSRGCLVLITSRRRLTALDNAHPLTLDVLAPPDAIALFTRVAGIPPQPAVLLSEVVELCGRLPLAIRILATRLRNRPAWTLADLATRLRDKHERLAQLETGRRSVAGAFRLSYDNLDAGQKRLFRLLGLHPGFDFDAYAAAALVASSLREAEHALECLVDAHLLESRRYGRYTFHDLLRAHAADTATQEESPAERALAITRLLDYYLRASGEAMNVYAPAERPNRPELPRTLGPSPSFAGEAQALRWLEAERANLVASARHAAVSGWPGRASQLSSCLHRYLANRLYSSDALVLHQNAVRAARECGDRAAEARALNCLAATYRNMGSHRLALDCLRSALECLPAGGDDGRRAEVYSDLGHVLIHMGRFFEAAGHCRRALRLYRKLGDRWGEARAVCDLGEVSRSIGDIDDALRHGWRVLELAQETGDLTAVINGYRLLGFTCCASGRYQDALDHLARCLRLTQAIGYRHGEYFALAGTAWALRELGRCRESLERCDQLLALTREIASRDSEYEAHQAMGETLVVCGRPDQAPVHLHRALELATAIQQEYDQARAHGGLGRAYRALGRVDQAVSHWRHAAELYRRLGVPGADWVERALAELDERSET